MWRAIGCGRIGLQVRYVRECLMVREIDLCGGRQEAQTLIVTLALVFLLTRPCLVLQALEAAPMN